MMEDRFIQIGLVPRETPQSDFIEIIKTSVDEIREALDLNSMQPRLLPPPFPIEDLQLSLNELAGVSAMTVFPRNLPEAIAHSIGSKYPLIVVIDTSNTNAYTKAVLLHEFGHAKRDYPTIWDLLQKTEYAREINSIEMQGILNDESNWNPFGNTKSEDPFMEFVAEEFSMRYVPLEAKAMQSLRIASHITELAMNPSPRIFCLELYLKIRSQLMGVKFPTVTQDKVSRSIAEKILNNDFPSYSREVITALFTDRSSRFCKLNVKCIIEQTNVALHDFGF